MMHKKLEKHHELNICVKADFTTAQLHCRLMAGWKYRLARENEATRVCRPTQANALLMCVLRAVKGIAGWGRSGAFCTGQCWLLGWTPSPSQGYKHGSELDELDRRVAKGSCQERVGFVSSTVTEALFTSSVEQPILYAAHTLTCTHALTNAHKHTHTHTLKLICNTYGLQNLLIVKRQHASVFHI